MVNVRGYISSNFTKSFLTVFLPFFLIISLVYLVKISALTKQVQIDFSELLLLYSYSLPNIIFYTIPLSFIAAVTNTLMKLSQDNELIALYALGLKAKKVLRSILLLGILFSVLLGTISFLGIPMSKQLYNAFKAKKKAEATLNIIPGKLGQKFGEYYIYVKKKDDKNDMFHTMVIYNRTKKNEEQFFSAREGKLKRNGRSSSLLLKKGYGYTYTEEKLQQVKYKTLEVFDTSQKYRFHFQDIIAYWALTKTDRHRMGKALFYLFVSLIPLLSVYLVAAFAMINPRYQGNYSFIIIFASTFLLYLVASSLEKWGNIPILIVSALLVFVFGRILFEKRVAKYF
ncbi:Predicted permease YjgP/YjgQ family [hydrothermal vent metagenome]|uniref:Predicted permease YjgP/YjgQ family n=1 Tax=hydrothermal vent metagenome TaxID=652676 RepID=A0A1W1BP34_9ZZZZ